MPKLFCIMKNNSEAPLNLAEQSAIDELIEIYDATAIVDLEVDNGTIDSALNHLDFGTNVVLPIAEPQYQYLIIGICQRKIDCEIIKSSYITFKW